MQVRKYPFAYHYKDEAWTAVAAAELENPLRRSQLKGLDLVDEINGTKSLGVRNHPDTPHFFHTRQRRKPLDGRVVNTEIHGDECSRLVSFLKANPKVDIGYYETPWNRSDMGFEVLVSTRDYIWRSGKETALGIVYGRLFIPDILGRSNRVGLVDSEPYVALEIVDTHFPSLETFQTVLRCTKDIPLVVCFYFCAGAPVENQKKNPPAKNGVARIRINYYVADGSFWQRNCRVEELVDDNCFNPEDSATYYNYIRSILVRDRLIRQGT